MCVFVCVSRNGHVFMHIHTKMKSTKVQTLGAKALLRMRKASRKRTR